MNLSLMRGFIQSAAWRYARTMPQAPHEYTVRKEETDEEFCEFVRAIRLIGSPRRFRGREYIYMAVDGYEYWTMGNPLECTRVINRVRNPTLLTE